MSVENKVENKELKETRPVQRKQVEEIDLLELCFVLWKKAWILLLCGLIGAILAGLYTVFLVTPQYQASSMIYILSKTTSLTSLSDLQLGTQLTEDFKILATSRPVVEQVIEELDLNATYGQMVNIITITNVGTRILKITVTHPDPQLAADISNAMAEAMRDQVAQVTNSDRPTTVEEAVVPQHKSSPNTKKNVTYGGLLGLCLAGGVIVLLYLLDDTIKNKDDVERYLGKNVLASIPVDSVMDENDKEQKKRKRSFGKRKTPMRHSAKA